MLSCAHRARRPGIAALALASALAGITVVVPGSAEARMVCGERDKIVKTLKDRFGESRRALGLQSGNRVLELFASTGGSWTAVVTDTRGRTCILGVGEAWTEFEPEPVGPHA